MSAQIEQQQLIGKLEAFITWAESELDNVQVLSQYVVEIDGTYVETDVPFITCQVLKRVGLIGAFRFEKNLAHRAKYDIEMNHNLVCKVVPLSPLLHSELLSKKRFLEAIRKSN